MTTFVKLPGLVVSNVTLNLAVIPCFKVGLNVQTFFPLTILWVHNPLVLAELKVKPS